jgi:hypothetical protein
MHGSGQNFGARCAITGELVRHYNARGILQFPQQLPEESSSCLLASSLLDENIENAAILINSAPQILQATTDLDKHFVEMPGVTEFSTSSADAFDVVSAKSLTPCSNCFAGYANAALGHHFLNVAIADGEPKVQPHAMADDFWRKAITTVCRGERVHGAIESEPTTT